jgi:glycosyltransferase involved in cell wall biosynthesis
VHFLGTLDRMRELPRLYASADAFCFASQTETLGLVVLEAMASGLPVIAIPALGVSETLRDGTNGLAVPGGTGEASINATVDAMAEAMVRVAQDRELRCRLRVGALATAAEFSWESELDRLDVSYREVLAGARGTVAPPPVAVAHA